MHCVLILKGYFLAPIFLPKDIHQHRSVTFAADIRSESLLEDKLGEKNERSAKGETAWWLFSEEIFKEALRWQLKQPEISGNKGGVKEVTSKTNLRRKPMHIFQKRNQATRISFHKERNMSGLVMLGTFKRSYPHNYFAKGAWWRILKDFIGRLSINTPFYSLW